MAKIVREFSSAGPCIELGELVSATEKSVAFLPRYGDRTVKRRGGWKLLKGLIHTEPCTSCTDHPRTSYPSGYMD